MINFELQWHPRFVQQQLDHLGGLFIGENDEFFIENAEYQALNSVIQSQGRLSDYALQSDSAVSQIERIKRVDTFINDSILVSSDGSVEQYSIPDFTVQPKKVMLAGGVVVYWLSQVVQQAGVVVPMLETLIQEHALQDTAIVITDDYLDPRLLPLHVQLKEQQDWLLIKLSGNNAMLGPFFSQHRPSAACYQCLLNRLKQNAPVREWYRRYTGSEQYLPVPVVFNQDKISAVIQQLPTVLKRLLDHSSDSIELYLYDTVAESGDYHGLDKRPQCQSCGDPDVFKIANQPPFQLDSVIRESDVDGGYRKLNREQTLEKIKQLIDPVTGIISDIQKISPEGKGQMSIYRAAYFQNSYDTRQLSTDTFVQLSLGKGVSDNQAKSSALGETLERQAAQYTGEEETLFGFATTLPYRAYLPHQLNPFSESQYQEFEQHSGVSLKQPQWVKKYYETTPLHWVAGWSFSRQETVYFPAAHCFANTPFEDHVYSLYTHNGNAAGNTMEEAILQGAFELIERDAVAIWWYNQIPRPEIDLAVIPVSLRKVIDATLGPDWHYWVLDISNDIDVLSCVAVGQHKTSGQFVLGFGTHFSPAIACARALTEMYQLIVIKDEVTGPFDFNAITPHPFLFPKRKTLKKTQGDFHSEGTLDIKDDINSLMALLDKRDLELCIVSYSRPDICLKTVKVIIPGLCHLWPQLGNQRLYSVPAAINWLSKPLPETLLNPMALYL
ncbi:MAG: TOMM precursor leader peptide-binding protein [Arenicella sp.]